MARAIPTPEVEGDMTGFIAGAAGISESDARKAACVIMLDGYMSKDEVLRRKTGSTADNFHLTCDALFLHMENDPNSPLYWGKAGTRDSAGRRCALAPRHMLFMYLEYLWRGLSQECVADTYGVSQTSVSRYFAYVGPILAKLLPTADNMAEDVRECKNVDEVQGVAARALNKLEKAAGAEPGSAGRPGKTLPGNIVMHDGTHVPKERATDRKERDASYSGKKKTYTNNVVLTANRDGLVIGMSDYAPGSNNDITVLRESGADLGLVTRCMEGKRSDMEVVEYVDKGFRGVQRNHPASVLKMPLSHKKSNTKAAKAHNRRVNSVRIMIEHVMRWCKRYARLRHRMRRMAHRARMEFLVVTGLVNLHSLTNSRDKARTHRKHKKPGPKTARSRS